MPSDPIPYPPKPQGAPANLTAPTGAYARSAWLALTGLLLFVALYLGLTVHFGRTAWVLGRDTLSGAISFTHGLLALPALFFFGFLVRGLFVVKHREDESLVEITDADQPELLAFVRRVADEAGAPPPHRVFLSARVNAAVFYDLSFRNLILPSKKNLELGLGLLDALSLDELKAVVAHEFGHFAQRTMAVGRWVYMAQQITGHIVASRGGFDRALQLLSGVDIRIAWIGWIMRLLVWAIRAVLDTAFRGIVLAHRALTREMELNADLVSVSVCGSDSLIHALHRLGAADEAWSRAVSFCDREAARGTPVADLFAVQGRILEHLREIYDDPEHGKTPERPEGIAPAEHRVFKSAIAQPPKMWSTHPPNREREDNAKRRYVPSPVDERESWVLLKRQQALREQVTRRFFGVGLGDGRHQPVPIEETLARVDEEFDRPALERRYRGAYLGRSVVSEASAPKHLYAPMKEDGRDAILARLDAIYPATLSADIERWTELCGEHAMLEGLKDGILAAPGGLIQHRGREIRRKELTKVIARTAQERDQALARVLSHDREVRTVHRLAARQVGELWDDYLLGLATLLHYADHTAANMADALGYLRHVFDIVTADGRVTGAERDRLIAAAFEVWEAMEEIFRQRSAVSLPPAVAGALGAETWEEVLRGPFDLPRPTELNIGDWLAVVESWGQGTAAAVQALTDATLAELLRAEATVERALRTGESPGRAPPPPWVPERYTTLVTGDERPRQRRLGSWDRFILADGWLPGAARLAVASALLVPVVLYGGGYAESAEASEPLAAYQDLAWSDEPAHEPVIAERSGVTVGRHLLPFAGVGMPSRSGATNVLDARERFAAAGPSTRARMCTEWRLRDDADAQYLAVRCLSRDEDRRRAHLDGYAAHPDHPWFRYAAGYEHARSGSWEQALEAWELARTGETAPLWPELAIEVARLRRASERDAGLADLEGASEALDRLMRIERGEGEAAWRELAAGRLEEAVRSTRSAGDPELEDVIVRLAGASEGAAPALVEAALARIPGDDPTSVFAMLALAAREGRDPRPYRDRLATIVTPDDARALESLLDLGRLRADPAGAERRLGRLVPVLRGQALVMMIVLLGPDAAPSWRREARALLFAAERPFFHAPEAD